MTPGLTRRDFSVRLASLFSVCSVAGTTFAFSPRRNRPASERSSIEELSHNAEAIHQEVIFNATQKRVYEALTDEKHFDRVIKLGEAAAMVTADKPTKISHEAGGSFSIFGAVIVGRNIELVVNQRLVQAWRETSWPPGVYSLAKFELTEQGPNTKLVFDHTGFPAGAGEHLAIGWKSHYWEPIKKFLISQ